MRSDHSTGNPVLDSIGGRGRNPVIDAVTGYRGTREQRRAKGASSEVVPPGSVGQAVKAKRRAAAKKARTSRKRNRA